MRGAIEGRSSAELASHRQNADLKLTGVGVSSLLRAAVAGCQLGTVFWTGDLGCVPSPVPGKAVSHSGSPSICGCASWYTCTLGQNLSRAGLIFDAALEMPLVTAIESQQSPYSCWQSARSMSSKWLHAAIHLMRANWAGAQAREIGLQHLKPWTVCGHGWALSLM